MLPPDTRAAILADLVAGQDTYRELAGRHRASLATICRIAQQDGLALGRAAGSPRHRARREAILADLLAGQETRRRIARRHGVSLGMVGRIASRSGIPPGRLCGLRGAPKPWPEWAIKRARQLGRI
jgi:Trp operon repressor